MNITTAELLSPAKFRTAASVMAIMALHGITLRAADPPLAAPVLDKRVAVVSLADLDTSTPQGARAARDRLRDTARLLCMRVQDSRDLGHQPHFVACVEQALTRALQQMRIPAVAALDATRNAQRSAP